MYNQERCIIFPRSNEAAALVESNVKGSRFEIEQIDLSYDQYAKLKLFGFFDYPKETGVKILSNSFVKIETRDIPVLIDSALISRKEIGDRCLLKVIDRFVEKCTRSVVQNLPIWFST